MMEPTTIGGVMLGGILDKYIPNVILYFLMFSLLTLMAWNTIKTAMKMTKLEKASDERLERSLKEDGIIQPEDKNSERASLIRSQDRDGILTMAIEYEVMVKEKYNLTGNHLKKRSTILSNPRHPNYPPLDNKWHLLLQLCFLLIFLPLFIGDIMLAVSGAEAGTWELRASARR